MTNPGFEGPVRLVLRTFGRINRQHERMQTGMTGFGFVSGVHKLLMSTHQDAEECCPRVYDGGNASGSFSSVFVSTCGKPANQVMCQYGFFLKNKTWKMR